MQQHLGVGAVRIGALGLLAPVVNQRSMAVWPSGPALAALVDHGVFAHGSFLAPGSEPLALPRRTAVRVSSAAIEGGDGDG